MPSHLKISQKIYTLGTLQFLLILLVGWIGYSQMNKIGIEIVEITEDDIPLTRMLTQLTEHQLQQAILFERAMLKGTLMEKNYKGAEEKYKTSKKEIESLSKKIKMEILEIEDFIEAAIPKLHTKSAVAEYKHLLSLMLVIDKHYQQVNK